MTGIVTGIVTGSLVLWCSEDPEGRMLQCAFAIAGIQAERGEAGATSPRLELADGVVLEGSVGILAFLQDASPVLTPNGFGRYRVAEYLNMMSTEVIEPADLAARAGLADNKRRDLIAGITHQLDLLAGQLTSSPFLVDNRSSIADIFLGFVIYRLDIVIQDPELRRILASIRKCCLYNIEIGTDRRPRSPFAFSNQ